MPKGTKGSYYCHWAILYTFTCVIMLKWWIHLKFIIIFYLCVARLDVYLIFFLSVVILRHIYFDFSCRNNINIPGMKKNKMFIAERIGDRDFCYIRVKEFFFFRNNFWSVDKWMWVCVLRKIELWIFLLLMFVHVSTWMSNFCFRSNAFFSYLD